jgi:hypothetical protein
MCDDPARAEVHLHRCGRGEKEQCFRTSSHYAFGSTLPLGPGTWTVERVEDTGLARWPEVGTAEEPEVRSFRLHCVVS